MNNEAEKRSIGYLTGKQEAIEKNVDAFLEHVKTFNDKLEEFRKDTHEALDVATEKILGKMERMATKDQFKALEDRVLSLETDKLATNSWIAMVTTKTGMLKAIVFAVVGFLISLFFNFKDKFFQ